MTETTSPARRREQADLAVLALARGPAMAAAIARLNEGRVVEAEAIVRGHLGQCPDDVAGLCMLADLAARGGVFAEAERLLRSALAREPAFTEAALSLVKLLARRDGVGEAIAITEDILADLPDDHDVALLRLTLLGQIGRYDEAVAAAAKLVAVQPRRPDAWLAFGHLLNTTGDLDGSVAAYRRSIDLAPDSGEAWWALANLKVYRFTSDETIRMERALSGSFGRRASAAPLHFALAKALEDRGDTRAAFNRYSQANSLRQAAGRYDPDAIGDEVDRSIACYTPSLFAGLAGAGHDAEDPIFITGLPRSGSTLVEQILASHSSIEGTAELPYIPMLVHQLLAERWTDRTTRFPGVLTQLPPERFRALGRAYLDAAAVHRQTERPYFIDKLPNNWLYVGFIHLILPNARIIDARRSPLACCWSNYRQWFARGQDFSYGIDDIGRYHRDYMRMSSHIDRVLPGRVRHIIYEDLIADPEAGIRDIVTGLGLPFEDACLRFDRNDRPVRTASGQQVRRPIQRSGADQWRAFEPYLQPLRQALDGVR